MKTSGSGGLSLGLREVEIDERILRVGTAVSTATDLEWLDERLNAIFASPSYRPPMLPQVALDLLRLIRSDLFSFEQVAKILERDAVLAGRVLRLVQSPLYARPRPILSLSQAVVRLGLTTLRDAILEVAVNTSVFRAGVYRRPMARVLLHLRATAHICRLVGGYSTQVGDRAFLCGLLHDVGFAGLLITLAEEAQSDPRLAVENVLPFWPALDRAHEAATGAMLKIWGFPPEIIRTLANHHTVPDDTPLDPTLAVLIIAEHLAGVLGCGMVMGETPLDGQYAPEPPVTLACERLGIPGDELLVIQGEAARLVGGLSRGRP